MDKIVREIVLVDSNGQVIKELKRGQTATVRVKSVPVYRIQDKEFSNNK